MDGKPETIVFYQKNNMTNHPELAEKSDIIKDNRIIFSGFAKILPAENSNGFYLETNNTLYKYSIDPMCCPSGFYRLRFISENCEFKPVFQQEIRYLKVSDDVVKKQE